MKYIDMHCDTITAFPYGEDIALYSNTKQVDVTKLLQGGAMAQFFAIFLSPQAELAELGVLVSDSEYFQVHCDKFYQELAKHSDIIATAGCYSDIIKNKSMGKISAVLTLEDGRILANNMDNLKWLYDCGVRSISLTWNYENCIAYPNSLDNNIMQKGLKPFGIELVEAMNNMGMIIDVSHLSDGGFYDVAKYSKKPFVATHSNSRAVINHPRNLTDDMIKVLAEKGGVTGLNFCSLFMNTSGGEVPTSIADIIAQAKHIVNVGGMDCLAIGGDLDGIHDTPEITSSADMPQLFHALGKAGFCSSDIEKIAHKNVERVLRDILVH